MKRLIAMLGCAVLLAAVPPAAMAQGTKTVKGSVTTVGGGPSVLNVWSEPLLVPPAFFAEILKW